MCWPEGRPGLPRDDRPGLTQATSVPSTRSMRVLAGSTVDRHGAAVDLDGLDRHRTGSEEHDGARPHAGASRDPSGRDGGRSARVTIRPDDGHAAEADRVGRGVGHGEVHGGRRSGGGHTPIRRQHRRLDRTSREAAGWIAGRHDRHTSANRRRHERDRGDQCHRSDDPRAPVWDLVGTVSGISGPPPPVAQVVITPPGAPSTRIGPSEVLVGGASRGFDHRPAG